MDKDTFLSILALDAYNRGPTPGVTGLSLTGSLGTAILAGALRAEVDAWALTSLLPR